jgi:hypothetical protein
MAILARPKDQQQYDRLVGMTQPSATPSKRIGTDAPVGSVATGPAAGKSAAEFTQTTKASPGSVFARQLGGADISGITSLAEKPLAREAGQEAMRVAGEGLQYKQTQQENLAKQPQFQFTGKAKEGDKEVDKDFTSDIIGKVAAGGEDFGTAQSILSRESVPVNKLEIGDVKEFTPLQALRGGSVESLIRKEATGPYSTGMAGLDALLFQKKGGAQQLGQRGIALRAAEQATADALEKSATAEAEEAARRFVSGQKEQLQAGIKGGLTAREEAYTKAPEGQKSKLQQAQEKLKSDYEATRGKATQEIQTKVASLKQQEMDKAFQAAYDRAYKQPYIPTEYERSTGQIDPSRAQMMVMQSALADPEYNRIKSLVQGEAGAGLSRLTQQGSIPYAESDLPTLGLQNVIGADEATQYNRLQQLLGGQTLTPQTLTAPSVGVNEAAIQAAYQNMLERLGR